MAIQNNSTPSEETSHVENRKKNIYKVSSTISTILRQFILAGIGIVWLFKVTSKDGCIILDTNLLLALKFLIGAIFAEFLHYLLEIVSNAIYLCGNLQNRNMPSWVAALPWGLWVIKLLLVLMAYILIGKYLF